LTSWTRSCANTGNRCATFSCRGNGGARLTRMLQMSKAKGPAANAIKQRAMQTLKRKKMYEAQRDNLSAQSFNVEQVGHSP